MRLLVNLFLRHQSSIGDERRGVRVDGDGIVDHEVALTRAIAVKKRVVKAGIVFVVSGAYFITKPKTGHANIVRFVIEFWTQAVIVKIVIVPTMLIIFTIVGEGGPTKFFKKVATVVIIVRIPFKRLVVWVCTDRGRKQDGRGDHSHLELDKIALALELVSFFVLVELADSHGVFPFSVAAEVHMPIEIIITQFFYKCNR